MAGVLSQDEIKRLLAASPPLVEGIDERVQLQPNGVDLTVREVALLSSQGQIGTSNDERLLSQLTPLIFDGLGFMELPPGLYLITYNEAVHLPKDVIGLGFPRSSLLRCGVTIHTAVWDAGYSGRSQSPLVVYNPAGFRLKQGSRVLQLVFLRLSGETEGYQGRFQRENL